MDEKILNSLNEFKKELNKHPFVIELNKIENELNNNEELMKLSYQKDMFVIEYEDAIKHFGKDSKEADEAYNKIKEIKAKTDSLDVVKRYYESYRKVQDLYRYITSTIFAPFTKE